MEISPAALVNAAAQMPQNQVAQEAQILVLKKVMDIQAVSVEALLQAVSGSLPLAASGHVGTQINTVA